MTKKNLKKLMIPIELLVFCLMVFNCSKAKADEPFIYIKTNLNERYMRYNEVISKYGEIWIGYTVANNQIVTETGDERFAIETANFFYKKDDIYISLGSLDRTGLYNKNGTCLKPIPKVALGYTIIGISSSLIEDILGPRLILQSQSNNNSWRETESFVIADIDTQNDTIMLMDMSRFLVP